MPFLPPHCSSACRFLFLLLVCRSLTAAPVEPARMTPLEIEVLSVEVNHAPLTPEIWNKPPSPDTSPLTLPSRSSLRVHFQDRSSENTSSPKLRYFLAGHDSEWHDLRAHAQLTIRFLDTDGAVIGSEDLNAHGDSNGWMGNVANSAFSPRSAKLKAPPRSKRIQLVLISSIPEMLGQYAVREIGLSISSRDGSPQHTVQLSTEEGVEMDNPLGNPLLWARSGTRAQLAQVITLRDGKHALALIDNESKSFGAWILKNQYCPEVSEGDEIVLNWSECFSLGRGGDGFASYENLPPGNYKLLVAGHTIEGRDFPSQSILTFKIPPPFWERPVFWIALSLATSASAFAIVRMAAKRKMQRHLADLEHRHLLEKERSRIARDIHDELGASLASIALLSTRTREQLAAHPESAGTLEEISKRATQTVRQLAEIVWAVNPARDSVENLVDFTLQFAQEYLELAKIRFRTEIPEELPELALSSTARHEVFLAAKELVHNAVRHGNPTLVTLTVQCTPEWLTLIIEDNGCGFTPHETTKTRGLSNVATRMNQIGGGFNADAAPGRGSRMQLRVPLTSPDCSR